MCIRDRFLCACVCPNYSNSTTGLQHHQQQQCSFASVFTSPGTAAGKPCSCCWAQRPYLGNVFIRAKRVSNCCMQEKKTDSLSVCPDVRLILVLVLGRQIVYGQNTVYLCLSKYIVFQNTQEYKHHMVRSIARSGVSPPGARSDGHHWCQAARTAATCM